MEARDGRTSSPMTIRIAKGLDPAAYSPFVSANRWRSLMYAIAGCRYMFRYQKNTRIQLLATLAVLLLAIWLEVSPNEWALIILATSMVWLAEFFNAAIEAAVNTAVSDFHPMARVAKDVAAASVLLAVLTSIAIGLIVLAPPFVERLQPALGIP